MPCQPIVIMMDPIGQHTLSCQLRDNYHVDYSPQLPAF